MEMRAVQQGTYAFLPPLSDNQVREQIQSVVDQGWAIGIEYTDDPSLRNLYWKMWGLPMFDVTDAAAIMYEFQACRTAYPDNHIRINGYDPVRQGQAVSFIAHWPNS